MIYHAVGLDKENLGLSPPACQYVADEVDVFIHNAWHVDFNLPLQSFESTFIRGLRTGLDISLQGRKRSHLVFISSISSISGSPTLEPYPEASVLDPNAPAKMGYAESKFVAEAILARASEGTGANITIARVGQVAGSSRPNDPPWPAKEWFPSLLATSKSLQLLPNDLPPLDWLPIDKVASAIVETGLHGAAKKDLQVYNLVNPAPVPYNSFLDILQAACGGPNVQLISLKEWIARLNASGPLNEAEFIAKPALKILDFLVDMAEMDRTRPARYETERARKVSPTMSDVQPVQGTWIELWLQQWGLLGERSA